MKIKILPRNFKTKAFPDHTFYYKNNKDKLDIFDFNNHIIVKFSFNDRYYSVEWYNFVKDFIKVLKH